MRQACIALACAFGILGSSAAHASDEVLHDPHPDKWGSPKQIVRPQYPKEAIERKISGYVDFEALVTVIGTLRDIEYRPGSKEAEIFVSALEKVVPYWTFYPAMRGDCIPVARRFATRVSFEMDGDDPRIFVTVTPRKDQGPTQSNMKVVKRVDPTYPRMAQKDGHEALVYSALAVEPDGRVSAVTTQVYPERSELRVFGAAAERAFMQWIFSPAPEGQTRTRVACMELHFRLH